MDRVHAALDGELPRTSLDEADRARLASLTSAIADTAAALRAAPVPDLTDAVMNRVADLPVPGSAESPIRALHRAIAWLWEPRAIPLTLRPAYAFAAVAMAALVTAISAGGAGEGPDTLPAVTSSAPESPTFYVQFRIEAAGASEVALAGSFTDWQPLHRLHEAAPGVWSVMVPLDPGVHDYTFLIDGERWVVDPYAPRVADSFGGSNSRLFLAGAGDAT